MLINKILNKITNWIGHILRKNYLLHDATKGQVTEVKRSRKKKTAPCCLGQQKKVMGNKGGS
jgi:hypothetical protein